MTSKFAVAVLLAACAGVATAQDDPSKPATVEKLIADLNSADGAVRTAATRELFARGKAVLPDLKKAGAKQITPFGTVDGTRRIDAVYSLIEGLQPNLPRARAGYTSDSFGLHVAAGTTADDVAAMAKKYGFTPAGDFRADTRPNVYVKLAPGKPLEDVLKRILAEEPKATTINLNYVER
jgi:hypothetical protein